MVSIRTSENLSAIWIPFLKYRGMVSAFQDPKMMSVKSQKKINPSVFDRRVLLPDEDSNLDKQNQNLSYYLYTIGQSVNRPQK